MTFISYSDLVYILLGIYGKIINKLASGTEKESTQYKKRKKRKIFMSV